MLKFISVSRLTVTGGETEGREQNGTHPGDPQPASASTKDAASPRSGAKPGWLGLLQDIGIHFSTAVRPVAAAINSDAA